jgi:hypothetical protein
MMLRHFEKPSGSACLAGAAAAALVLLCTLSSLAQEVTESALKASYIYKIATFTKWPADAFPGTTSSVFCVLGDATMAEALERAVKGRLHAGLPITVSRVTATGSLKACRLLYLSGVPAVQSVQILTSIRDLPVLTLSDSEGFCELGGIAQLFFERGRLSFNLRVEPAKRAGLELSSGLLVLARKQ